MQHPTLLPKIDQYCDNILFLFGGGGGDSVIFRDYEYAVYWEDWMLDWTCAQISFECHVRRTFFFRNTLRPRYKKKILSI